jgi:hypothetical protein
MTSLTPFTALGTNGNVPSDSGSLLIWTNLASNTQYEWYVSVSDGVNTTNSPVWTFTTGTGAPQPPAITDEPDSQTVQCGNNALLSVVVTSETTPDYQWYFGATPLADKTNATLSLLAAGESDEGTYKVVVHNLGGSVTSAPAVITIIDTNPPTVAGYPTNTTIGANASCQASIPDLASQVVADDACSGVAVTQLPLAGSVVGLGAYPVILTIKDAANNQTTRNALVTVVDGVVPLITSQPQSSTNIAGSTGGFAVSASSCTPLAYQWRIGDSAIPSETGSALTITNVQPGNGGGYSVVLSNAAGYSTSIVATLTVISPAMPGLFIQPTLLPNGHFYAGFTGTPNLPYTIKYATDVTGPWQTLTNITSDGIGLIPIDDIPAPAPSSRFYRVVYP